MLTDGMVDWWSSTVADELSGYGVAVEDPTLVDIHPDAEAPAGYEDARATYSPVLDAVTVYSRAFETEPSIRDVFAHEYVHKHQVDSEVGVPSEEYRETVERLDKRCREYAMMMQAFGRTFEEQERFGLHVVTEPEALDRRALFDVVPDRAETIYDLAVEEYEQAPPDRRKEVYDTFIAALDWEVEDRRDELDRMMDPLFTRLRELDDADVDIGPADEAVAYYAGIALGGRVDDTAYIESEKEEILDPERNYDEPERQVELLEELLEDHRSLRDDGLSEAEVIRTVLSENV